MKSLWQKILSWFAKQKPTPKPEPVKPKPDIGGDHPTFVGVQGGAVMWSSLKETAKILDSGFDASGFWARTDRKWPVKQDNNPEGDGYLQDGVIALIWDYKGAWQGCYFDCSVAVDGYKYVSHPQHVYASDSGFVGRMPVKGQKIAHVFISNAGNERTSLAWGVWPL